MISMQNMKHRGLRSLLSMVVLLLLKNKCKLKTISMFKNMKLVSKKQKNDFLVKLEKEFLRR